MLLARVFYELVSPSAAAPVSLLLRAGATNKKTTTTSCSQKEVIHKTWTLLHLPRVLPSNARVVIEKERHTHSSTFGGGGAPNGWRRRRDRVWGTAPAQLFISPGEIGP